MKEFLVTLAGIIITGLGYLTYNRPSVAKWIVLTVTIFWVAAYILYVTYSNGKISGTWEASQVIDFNDMPGLEIKTKSKVYEDIKNVWKAQKQEKADIGLIFIIGSSILVVLYYGANIFKEHGQPKENNG